jgi:hypothetical protein
MPGQPPRVCRLIGCLETMGIALRIEQGMGQPVCSKARAQLGQQRGLRRELQGAGLIIGVAVGDQFRQADGGDQAGADTRGERAPGPREHRQPAPQRVARRGVGVDVEGVEKQIGMPQPGEMLGMRQRFGEDQPGGIDAPRLGFAAQVRLGPIVRAQQPQDAAFGSRQQSHPDVEFARPDLVVVVEAAEHKIIRGQAEIRARCPCRGDGPLLIVGLITAGKADDLFAVMLLLFNGNDHRICNEIVDITGAQRPRIADVADLQGRHAPGKDARARMLGMALEIHGDVEGIAAREVDDGLIGQPAHIHEPLDLAHQPRAMRTVGGRPIAVNDNLETVAVMFAQEARHQIQRRMLMKVGRKITDAKARPGAGASRSTGDASCPASPTQAREMASWRAGSSSNTSSGNGSTSLAPAKAPSLRRAA